MLSFLIVEVLNLLCWEFSTLQKIDVIFLQETWLAKQYLNVLNKISEDHLSFGILSLNYRIGFKAGRPFGGTAILWKRSLKESPVQNSDCYISNCYNWRL